MKKNTHYLIVSFFIAIIFNLSAQIDFEEHILIDNTNQTDGARSVFTADLDGDGDMDVLSASLEDNKIAWYENENGLGSFGEQQTISLSAIRPRSVYAADMDGDGDMDVLSASALDDKIAWYENENGLGSFGDQQIISTNADLAASVYVADIDGDSDMDVLSASRGDDKIAWYENENGLGSFSNQQIITTNAIGANSVYAADIDNDGDMDVLSASRLDDKIAWYENTNGLGDFSSQQIITTNADGALVVRVMDLDNDGDLDILSASGDDSTIAWYENTDGLGNWGNQQVISQNADGATFVFATDINGDGDVDALSASWTDNKIAWYENEDGAGNFGEQQLISLNTKEALVVHTADLDGDGDMDVLSASFSDDKIAWYENLDGLGNFGEQQNINYSTDMAKAVYATDIDGDNDTDVLSISENKITLHKNLDGFGSFSDPQEISIDIEINDGSSVYAADIDSDGDMDVLAASYLNSLIVWHENLDGQGDLWASEILSMDELGPRAVYAADIDGDSDVDVLTAANFANQISWYENEDGLGNFGAQQIINQNVELPNNIYAFDLDGDGDLDVLSGSDDRISWHENLNGFGDFGAQQTILDNFAVRSAFAPDIDGDGDLDVVSIGVGEVIWFENLDGQGAFGSKQIISMDIAGGWSVYAIDLDNDGDIDVLSASASDDKIAWYENLDGLGNFGTQQIISADADGAFSVYAADIDDDGDIDVLSASLNDGKIAWYENLTIVISTHSPDDHSNLDFQVSPNPTSDLLHIQATTDIAQIEIYNSLGQLLIGHRNRKSIDLSNLSKGLYLCKVQDVDGNWGVRKVCVK